jgi:hypothetical protein
VLATIFPTKSPLNDVIIRDRLTNITTNIVVVVFCGRLAMHNDHDIAQKLGICCWRRPSDETKHRPPTGFFAKATAP